MLFPPWEIYLCLKTATIKQGKHVWRQYTYILGLGDKLVMAMLRKRLSFHLVPQFDISGTMYL